MGTGAYTVGYTYEHNGNRLTVTPGGSTATYAYNAHDKLQSAGAKAYGYDANGNCKMVITGGQTTTLIYDAENRVTQISYPGGSVNTFAHNELGLCVAKNDSGGAFAYVCDGTDVASLAYAAAHHTAAKEYSMPNRNSSVSISLVPPFTQDKGRYPA